MMCVSDLLATGQPSEVKRVRPWGLADRVKGPGISDTSERMQLPLNQALWMDRQKTGPRAGLPPLLPNSPSWEPYAPRDTDVVQTPLGLRDPRRRAAILPVLGAPGGGAGVQAEESFLCAGRLGVEHIYTGHLRRDSTSTLALQTWRLRLSQSHAGH